MVKEQESLEVLVREVPKRWSNKKHKNYKFWALKVTLGFLQSWKHVRLCIIKSVLKKLNESLDQRGHVERIKFKNSFVVGTKLDDKKGTSVWCQYQTGFEMVISHSVLTVSSLKKDNRSREKRFHWISAPRVQRRGWQEMAIVGWTTQEALSKKILAQSWYPPTVHALNSMRKQGFLQVTSRLRRGLSSIFLQQKSGRPFQYIYINFFFLRNGSLPLEFCIIFSISAAQSLFWNSHDFNSSPDLLSVSVTFCNSSLFCTLSYAVPNPFPPTFLTFFFSSLTLCSGQTFFILLRSNPVTPHTPDRSKVAIVLIKRFFSPLCVRVLQPVSMQILPQHFRSQRSLLFFFNTLYGCSRRFSISSVLAFPISHCTAILFVRSNFYTIQRIPYNAVCISKFSCNGW